MAVTVPVVVAKEVIALGTGAATDFKGLVNGCEEVFCKIGDEAGDVLEVALGVARGEATEKVSGEVMTEG